MTPGGVSTFRCVASCSPPCNYQWKVKWGETLLENPTGDSISLSPFTDTVLSENLTCRVEEPVSGLYISKTVEVQVASTRETITGKSKPGRFYSCFHSSLFSR